MHLNSWNKKVGKYELRMTLGEKHARLFCQQKRSYFMLSFSLHHFIRGQIKFVDLWHHGGACFKSVPICKQICDVTSGKPSISLIFAFRAHKWES